MVSPRCWNIPSGRAEAQYLEPVVGRALEVSRRIGSSVKHKTTKSKTTEQTALFRVGRIEAP